VNMAIGNSGSGASGNVQCTEASSAKSAQLIMLSLLFACASSAHGNPLPVLAFGEK